MTSSEQSGKPGQAPARGGWDALLGGERRQAFERAIAADMAGRRWFRGKARPLERARIADVIAVRRGGNEARILIVEAVYSEGAPETYVTPLTAAALHDAMEEGWFREALLEDLAGGATLAGERGEIVFLPASADLDREAASAAGLAPVLIGGEQSNTSIRYGERFVLKLCRRVEPGVSPDVEMGSFLTARGFAHAPAIRGRIEYRPRDGGAMVIGVLADHVAHETDGWRHALAALERSLDRARSPGAAELEMPPGSLVDLARTAAPLDPGNLLGDYAGTARLLGRRTAELHLALASDAKDPAFAPEPFGPGSRRAFHASIMALVREVFALLRRGLDDLEEGAREKARRVLDLEGTALERTEALLELPIASLRIRCHGDYHLGQVLWTGRDVVITDFEGEVSRPLDERRAKCSALRDVAGMIRSFHYAAGAALLERKRGAVEERAGRELAARGWSIRASALFLGSYLERAGSAPFVPPSRAELEGLLDAHLLEKAVYEVGYELNSRPQWVSIPLDGVLEILGWGQAR